MSDLSSEHKPIRIHDTVHGYITLPWEYAVRFVDTPQFQRLRRIEQSAVRSLFPTARHDRFTHSLGVYHVGCLIEEHFKEEWKAEYLKDFRGVYDSLFDKYPEIVESYKIACLLHDVGHAPFSHTLEDFFGGNDINKRRLMLEEALKEETQKSESEQFWSDYDATRINSKSIPKPHEFSSAIVCVKCYGDSIKRTNNASIDYVVRMILGVKFNESSDERDQLANIFIELLHGETIDADRLDYACRDTWASGYCTSSVDMRRLIYAMHIRNTENGIVLCYNDKVVNEIESLLNVKDFQVKYIFNHHVVVYDQYLLQMAAKTMSRHFFPHPFYDKEGKILSSEEQQNKAMACFINIDALIASGNNYCPQSSHAEYKVRLNGGAINIAHIADEDILFLMKQTDNPYYEEWASRQYKYYPLWKTRDEFHTLFPESIGKTEAPNINKVKQTILSALQTDDSNSIIILPATFRGRTVLTNLKLWSNGKVIDYSELSPKEGPIPYPRLRREYQPQKETIFYVYYRNSFMKEQQAEREKERKELLGKLEGPLNAFYKNELH